LGVGSRNQQLWIYGFATAPLVFDLHGSVKRGVTGAACWFSNVFMSEWGMI
jgi:hypothetical protein